jgi:hypothetical protein
MADHVRDEFCTWVAGTAPLPGRATRSEVFEHLAHDRSRLPAAVRFNLSGCDVVTVAHAARLLRRLDAQGMLDGHDSVVDALQAVPPCVLHGTVRLVEESLRPAAGVGAAPRAPT